MYNTRHAQLFCKDDPSEIENFAKAKTAEEMYDLHHRLETELNVSAKWLKAKNMYFKRPAAELIFLTRQEHAELHAKSYHYLSGKHLTSETKSKLSEAMTGKPGLKGDKSPMYGKTREKNPNYKKLCPAVLYCFRSVLGLTQLEIANRLSASLPKVIKELKFYGIARK